MVSSGSFGLCHPPPPASELLLPVALAASLGSVSLLVGFELNSSLVSSLVPTVPSVQAHAASFFFTCLYRSSRREEVC
jgi:hypothetical protein